MLPIESDRMQLSDKTFSSKFQSNTNLIERRNKTWPASNERKTREKINIPRRWEISGERSNWRWEHLAPESSCNHVHREAHRKLHLISSLIAAQSLTNNATRLFAKKKQNRQRGKKSIMNRLLKLQVIQSGPLFELGPVKRKKKLRSTNKTRNEKNQSRRRGLHVCR